MKTFPAFRTLLASAVLLTAATLPAAATGPAGPSGTVSGRLFDGQTQEPIPHSYVVVLRAADGRFVKSGQTDAQGRFRVTGLPLGSYTVRTTILGYHGLGTVVALRPTRSQLALGTVVMVPVDMPLAARANKHAWARRNAPVAELAPVRPLVRVRS
ncbi:carboxypeptidase-like regulatory domain-containing protein [Hymenobacter rubripertinctus]|uniref:Carboxypeptidase regulatory-like domain-containing protein n=1 Tax=Hymenobacter rubripertinctus TaxID=2029981 RepID=A0A418QX60_9BACT|nr:carboxypeptidase-like regulatory domain-containing protein [Hymenobacter rubripertinctus]RIY09741.1 carboxypeptidase regulatory-like domain-containing protein [Hymenobacter rubripertinctus]